MKGERTFEDDRLLKLEPRPRAAFDTSNVIAVTELFLQVFRDCFMAMVIVVGLRIVPQLFF